MLHDRVRMESFQRAIFAAVHHLIKTTRPTEDHPLRVLDVGAGYGILSYWAVEAVREHYQATLGAQERLPIRVYAVEGNPVTAGEAYKRLDEREVLFKGVGGQGEVLILNANSYRLTECLGENQHIIKRFDPEFWSILRQKQSSKVFDLIISETLGSIGDNEDIVSILDHAIAVFLKSEGLVIPSTVRSFLVPIAAGISETSSVTEISSVPSVHRAVADLQYSKISSQYELTSTTSPFDMFYDSIIPAMDHLSKPVEIKKWGFDYSEVVPDSYPRREYSVIRRFKVNKEGLFSGFKGYFIAELANHKGLPEAVVLDISGDEIESQKTTDCWKHLYLPIEKQIRVAEGDEITLTFERKLIQANGQRSFAYSWHGEVTREQHAIARFSQERETSTPFMPQRESIVSRMIRTFALVLEAAHLGVTILPETDAEIAEILSHSLRNNIWDGITSLQSGAVLSEQQQEEAKQKRSAIGADIEKEADQRLKECCIAFPSIEHEGQVIYASGNGRLRSAIGLEGAASIIYKVNPEIQFDYESERDRFITVETRRYSESGFTNLLSSLRNGLAGFAAALIIPEAVYSQLSDEDIENLPSLMYFLQVRIFIDILSADKQKDKLFAHVGTTTHELKQLADSISIRWMSTPSVETTTYVRECTDEPWKKTDWAAIPFPGVIHSISRMIRLWSFYEYATGILPDKLPICLDEWVSDCWTIATSNLSINACMGMSFSNQEDLQEVSARLAWITEKLEAVIDVWIEPAASEKVSPIPVSSDDTPEVRKSWMDLTRWLVSVMSNYLRHGEISAKGLRLEIRMIADPFEPSLEVLARNRKREDETLPRWFPAKKTGSVTRAWLAVTGQRVQKYLVAKLNGDPWESPEEDNPHIIKVAVPMRLLWSNNS